MSRNSKQTGDPYGCHSKVTGPTKPNGYWVITREYDEHGDFEMKKEFIVSATTRKCRSYLLWDTDESCAGCTQPKDLAFATKEPNGGKA